MQIERARGDLGNNSVGSRHPIRKGQVVNLSEIIVGHEFTRSNSQFRFRVLAEPAPHPEFGSLWVEVQDVTRIDAKPQLISLADSGVVPYSNGLWNRANYLVRAEPPSPVNSLINRLISGLRL